MKHYYKIISVLFLAPLFSLAQSNYQPGKVVTSSGDTLRGVIDYQAWTVNPETIFFKLLQLMAKRKNSR